MIKIVNWNVGKRAKPWHELVRMARNGDADLALLQEAGSPPGDLVDLVEDKDRVFWNRHLYDRWSLVVKLSDQLTVTQYRQVTPISDLGADAIGVSGIGTIAAARVIPHESEEEAFVAVSMYARWLKPHPSTKSSWSVGYSDASAHRIISDLSAFIGHRDPAKHRILAAGDLNMFYGATGYRLSLPERDRTIWDRMQALGLEFLVRRRRTAGARNLRQPTYPPTRRTCRPSTTQGQARNRCESTGLRVRVTRVPREGVGTSDEPCWRVGTERSLPPDDRGLDEFQVLELRFHHSIRITETDQGTRPR